VPDMAKGNGLTTCNWKRKEQWLDGHEG